MKNKLSNRQNIIIHKRKHKKALFNTVITTKPHKKHNLNTIVKGGEMTLHVEKSDTMITIAHILNEWNISQGSFMLV